jgi:UDP-2-acetamido-3-amino-2,3-dideoxy-glucuronate N-acetyltransferase
VRGGAAIGKNVVVGRGAYIGPGVLVGDNCKIQNNVSLYDAVRLEDDVFCGPSMVFTNVINPRSEIERKHEYLPTLVRRGATLGANCTVICGITVGEYAFVGAGAVVTADVPDYALMVGVPARQIGWMSRYGDRIQLPLEGTGEWVCPHRGVVYRLDGRRVRAMEPVGSRRSPQSPAGPKLSR